VFSKIAAAEEPAGRPSLQRIRAGELNKLHRKAYHFKEEGEWNKAVDTYREILLIEPDDETAYTNLGSIHMILGNYRRAEDAFKNALHINPDNRVALLGLQKIYDPDNPVLTE
jgi:cytochrome c-type biogenesis protein CcmH/NrfG